MNNLQKSIFYTFIPLAILIGNTLGIAITLTSYFKEKCFK